MPSAWVEEVEEFTWGRQATSLDPVAWALHVSSIAGAAGAETPSPELAELLVDHVCCSRDASCAWKYLDSALTCNLVPPVVAVALLSVRVIPRRHVKPAAYRLYMEILQRHLFSFSWETSESSCRRFFILADDILGLSRNFGVHTCDTGVILIEFILCIMWQLVDATLEDEGLLSLTSNQRARWLCSPNYMEIDEMDNFVEERVEYSDKVKKANTAMSIELIAQLIQNKIVSRLLYLANQNMQSEWESFSQCISLLTAKSATLKKSAIPAEAFIPFSLNHSKKVHKKHLPIQDREFCAISCGLALTTGHTYELNNSSLWIPLDLFLEDAIKGSIAATSSVDILYGLVKALQAVNRISWSDTFLSLWLAALRLVQRERDIAEVPEPDVDIRLCMLLSIVPLTVADLIEEEFTSSDSSRSTTFNLQKEKSIAERSKALASCLQILGEYETLLAPPASVVSSANQAARKAVMVVSGIPVATDSSDCFSLDDNAVYCSGNLRHLIVEACIARNLLDISAYYWPGYVNVKISKTTQSIPTEVSSWSALMIGVPLKSLMLSSLVNTPASSLTEIEKIFEITVNGSVDDKINAAAILCGASLVRGWNFQEYTVCLVVKLLSPPIPVDYSGSENYLISHAPILNVVLTMISAHDCIQIFSLHGLVPELAGSLMSICEAFGSYLPDKSWTLPTGDSISAHTVFSNAFMLLLRLWKFNHSPLEYCILGDMAPLGSKLNPDYLLSLRNLDILSFNSSFQKKRSRGSQILTGVSPKNSIILDSFPKLKVWYQQHQACLASTLSGLVSGTPVRQNVDYLLKMMFKNMDSAGHSTESTTSSCGSLTSSSVLQRENDLIMPILPAWDIMEAVPFVVDAALTACSCGRLSPRELVTGLKDLVDFIPATLGAIVSYFTAEATRGVWKPAFMNGTDWPSPAANLSTLEEHIKKIVATTGVDVPSLVSGNSPATLPLPLAAFLSLTITYNLDKSSELNLVGPALESLATSCPWPSMPIVSALWAQKVKRWSYFLTFSSSGTIFYHNNDAVVQLLRSCFSAFLGLNGSTFLGGGVGSLLGQGSGPSISSGLSPVAPGILYLKIHQKIRDMYQLSEEILSTLMLSVRELGCGCLPKEIREKRKNSKYWLRYGHVSFFSAMIKAKSAASLGAILIWLSGDSGLIQLLIREILPSWFLSVRNSDQDKSGMVALLEGYTLAYLVVLCGMFAWGIETTWRSKRRSKTLVTHLKFLADVFDGKFVLGCNSAVWQAYVAEFLGLLVDCAPNWFIEVELDLLKRLSWGLKSLNKQELAIQLLERAGSTAMGAAAELIINSK